MVNSLFNYYLKRFGNSKIASVIRKIPMAGIYIHIPFCKQACYYCNFHFSTLLSYKEKLVAAIAKELFLRKDSLAGETIDTIYFGGGTPSLLSESEFYTIYEAITQHYNIEHLKEFTLEANPDDLSDKFLNWLKHTPVDRLSIGIQSFEDVHLKYMNRAHTAAEAITSVQKAQSIGINRISIDLIYGIPGMEMHTWENNLNKAFSLEIDHLSSYCLTLEPNTVFGKLLKKEKMSMPKEESSSAQFNTLQSMSAANGFLQYEISNFGKAGAFALHNTNYWNNESYLGVGPGAHSFFPGQRMWNISNNQQYMRSIEKNELPLETENLSLADQFNEYVMTGLRTMWGIDLAMIEKRFGIEKSAQIKKDLAKHIASGKLLANENSLLLSKDGKFFADGIASDAFIVNP